MSNNHEKLEDSQSISAKSHHGRKMEADRIPKVTIQDMQKRQLFRDGANGRITWEDQYIGARCSFLIHTVVTDEDHREEGYIEFVLPETVTSKAGTTSVAFMTTKGTFGGKRYWFKCTGTKCRKKIATLYLKESKLACLTCHNLTYKSRNLSGARKKLGRVLPIGELERLGKSVRRFEYAGKPTKRFMAYIKKRNRSMKAFDHSVGQVDELAKKINAKL